MISVRDDISQNLTKMHANAGEMFCLIAIWTDIVTVTSSIKMHCGYQMFVDLLEILHIM